MSTIDQKRAELNAKRVALIAEIETFNKVYQIQLDLAKKNGTGLSKAKQESLHQQHNLGVRLSAFLTKVEDELKALG